MTRRLPPTQEAVRLGPESVATMNSLGEAYAQAGRNGEAAGQFEKILRLRPYWGPAHMGLGQVLEAMGQTNDVGLTPPDKPLSIRAQHASPTLLAGEVCFRQRLV